MDVVANIVSLSLMMFSICFVLSVIAWIGFRTSWQITYSRIVSSQFSTICRELKRVGLSLKKLKKFASEWSEEKRAGFVYCMAQYTPEQLGFINETSKDERVPGRRRGYGKKGQRARRKQVFVRGHRLTGTGLLTLDGMVASTVLEGSMTGVDFIEFLHEYVVRRPVQHLVLSDLESESMTAK
jgi:hypothetical protein